MKSAMPIIWVLIVMALIFFGAGILAFSIWIFASLWHLLEAILFGLVWAVGIIALGIVWSLRTGAKLSAWTWRLACRLGLIAAQRNHSLGYAWIYWIKRRFIAMGLRARRKNKQGD
jgi:hypothetical protein